MNELDLLFSALIGQEKDDPELVEWAIEQLATLFKLK